GPDTGCLHCRHDLAGEAFYGQFLDRIVCGPGGTGVIDAQYATRGRKARHQVVPVAVEIAPRARHQHERRAAAFDFIGDGGAVDFDQCHAASPIEHSIRYRTLREAPEARKQEFYEVVYFWAAPDCSTIF